MSRTKCDLQWSCHWSHLWLGNALLCIPRSLHNSNTCTSARFLQQQMIKLHQSQFSETLHKWWILQTFIDFPVTIVIIELVICFGAKDKVTDILKQDRWSCREISTTTIKGNTTMSAVITSWESDILKQGYNNKELCPWCDWTPRSNSSTLQWFSTLSTFHSKDQWITKSLSILPP